MTGAQGREPGQGEQPSWDEVAAEVCTGFREWRLQHPRATFKEIETALDERLARVRARMLADAAVQSAARDLREVPLARRPVCPDCGGQVVLAGQEERVLTTSYEQQLAITRSATQCTVCGRRVFPSRGKRSIRARSVGRSNALRGRPGRRPDGDGSAAFWSAVPGSPAAWPGRRARVGEPPPPAVGATPIHWCPPR